jgi:hypothetical protein
MLKFLVLFLLCSCSYFIAKIDTPLVQERRKITEISQKKTYCRLDQKFNVQLVGCDDTSQKAYLDLVSSLGQVDFLDQFALWSLLQMTSRPDQSSPTSRFQLLFHTNGQSHYFDFFSEVQEDQYPYLYGIEWVLKKFGKKHRLEHYAALMDKHLGRKLKVSKSFEDFLVKNLEGIKANPELYAYYFRGSQILQENETAPPIKYSEIIKSYRAAEKGEKIIVNTYLTPFSTAKGQSGSCNYDFNLYDNSIFLIDKVIPVTNLFGLSQEGSAFMASSSQKIEKYLSLFKSPLFKGDSKVRSSAVCIIENESNRIWAFSNQSRDPGQHLFHLVRYGLPKSKSTPEVDRLIRHSRHLFLSDPVRLIIESNRSREDQVENLLKLNLPIYNAEKLGNIWSYTSFAEKSRFIIDDRNIGAFTCQ